MLRLVGWGILGLVVLWGAVFAIVDGYLSRQMTSDLKERRKRCVACGHVAQEPVPDACPGCGVTLATKADGNG